MDIETEIREQSANSGEAIPAAANRRNHTPLWVLLSVVVGFLLPVCSCGLLFGTSLMAVGQLTSSSRTSQGTGDAVAIIRVEGVMTTSDNSDVSNVTTGASSGIMIEDLKTAAADPSVKAILIRINSPGGDVTAAAQVYEVIQQIEKPIVVSMSSIAASGGYYVSAPADYIFARPDTITGSLGVIMSMFNASELIDELGVEVIVITSGPNKALGSLWENLTEEQREILEILVNESYKEFVRIVSEGRGLSRERVIEIADGRVYSGRQALELGLVDELGNLQNAIDKAAELGGITGQPRLVEYEHIPSLAQLLLGLSARLNQSNTDQIIEALTEFSAPTLEYRYVGPGVN